MFFTFSQLTETLHTFYTMNWYSVDVQVVKQTVMTVVYGVTWVGGRLQIEVSTCRYYVYFWLSHTCLLYMNKYCGTSFNLLLRQCVNFPLHNIMHTIVSEVWL